ncbi:MAG TPA: beta-propeller domain-containing protein [archaeon]|nr:beta-propeller domain-containing protein [archaeon]
MIATKAYAGLLVIAVIVSGFYIALYNPSMQKDDANLKTFASEQELKEFLSKTQSYQPSYYGDVVMRQSEALAPNVEKAGGNDAASDYSQTNIQVEGVDEADIVKNDGKYIYLVHGNAVQIIDAYPAESAQIISNITVENPGNIFINGDNLVVFSQPSYYYGGPMLRQGAADSYYTYYRYSQKTSIQIYDISDKSSPKLKTNSTIDGYYFDSRMIGEKVYAVINVPAQYSDDFIMPVLNPKSSQFQEIYYSDSPDASYNFINVISFDMDGLFTNKAFLFGSAQNMYVSQDNIYVTYPKYVPYYETEKRLLEEALLPLLPQSVSEQIKTIFAESGDAYEKQQRSGEVLNSWMRTLSQEEQQNFNKQLGENMQKVYIYIAKEQQKTIVHKISLADLKYKASGEFPGHLLNQFSLDEYNGKLRVATTINRGFFGAVQTTGVPIVGVGAQPVAVPAESAGQVAIAEPSETPGADGTVVDEQPVERTIAPPRPVSNSANNVYVLDESLQIAGKLEDLAKGEQIYSARFMGEKLYLVTFVRTDPLFVIDLSTDQPRVLGELKIPGVSQYLHPYDETHIIGVGQDAADTQGRTIFTGIKVSLFDVTDVANPKEISSYKMGERGSSTPVSYDHKAFLFSKSKGLMVLPVQLASNNYQTYQTYLTGAYVFSVDIENGFVLKGSVTHADNKNNEPYYYAPQVTRVLYMDNTLYTISSSLVKANSLDDMSEIKSVELPQDYQIYGIAIE